MATDAPRYYRVSPRFWSSADRKGWDDDTRLLALYLLTCDHRTTEGLYRLPKPYVCADLGWTPERLAKPFTQLLTDGFIDYDENAQVVLILKALRYQACANDNMAKAAVKRLLELPETALTSTFKRLAEQYDERLAERLPERFGEQTGEPQALALALAQAPSPGESRPDGRTDDTESTFDQFWQIYPQRNGRKPGRTNALIEWRKLTVEQRRRAYIGARNLAASDEMPKDAERFLRRAKGGKGSFPFDDWQQPATPGTRGQAPPAPDNADFTDGWDKEAAP